MSVTDGVSVKVKKRLQELVKRRMELSQMDKPTDTIDREIDALKAKAVDRHGPQIFAVSQIAVIASK